MAGSNMRIKKGDVEGADLGVADKVRGVVLRHSGACNHSNCPSLGGGGCCPWKGCEEKLATD
jgi:hypothetical protein